MKKLSPLLLLLLLTFMSCQVNEPIAEIIEEEESFTCPDGLTIPSGIVGTVDNPFQGDILVDQSFNKQVGVTTELWDDRIVPLYFDERWSEEQKNLIKGSLWQLVIEGFTFPEIDKAAILVENPIDFIYVKYSGIARSYIGKLGGEQQLYLPVKWMTPEVIIHEFGHAIGLHHPHVTDMQDEWLTIHWDNIQEEHKGFFRKYTDYGDDHTGQKEGFEYGDQYDIYSVMTYGSNAFAIDVQKPTMTLKDGTWFEPGDVFTELDLISINRMYNCYELTKN